jgi:hypothetical protein
MMMSASEKLYQGAFEYWRHRLEGIMAERTTEMVRSERQFGELAQALLFSIDAHLAEFQDRFEGMSEVRSQSDEETASDLVGLHQALSLIDIQVEDYLTTVSGAPTAGLTTAQPAQSSPFRNFLGKLRSLLSGLKKWLIELLATATKLKGWKLSGSLGNNVWGLAQANLEISFGN